MSKQRPRAGVCKIKVSHSVEWGDHADGRAPDSKITYGLISAALDFGEITETARNVSLKSR
jgi:hypothetical protein